MDVHRAIADLARTMHAIPEADTDGLDLLLKSITVGAVAHVPGARWASVLLVDNKKNFVTIAETDPVMHVLDQLQLQTGQGPCLDAAWEQSTVRVDDIATDARWPQLSARIVAETPARSSVSFQLFLHQGSMGALNIFSDQTHIFTPEAEEIGMVYATHAAIAVFRTRQQDNFRSALASRDIIGQAKGIIMSQFHVDAHRAFELLRQLSQNTNVPLVEVAEQLIAAELTSPQDT